MSKLSILDYGAGNLGSVVRAFNTLGVDCTIVTTAEELESSGATVFPGVGAAGQAMQSLKSRGLDEAIVKHVRQGKPLLGICVGMQVLGEYSEEDNQSCLGLLPYRLCRFQTQEPVPHMGWNSLLVRLPEHPLFTGIRSGADVYYVHSYFAPVELVETRRPDYVVAVSQYAGVDFIAAVCAGPLWGMQFHAEKSGKIGLTLLQNFVKTYC